MIKMLGCRFAWILTVFFFAASSISFAMKEAESAPFSDPLPKLLELQKGRFKVPEKCHRLLRSPPNVPTTGRVPSSNRHGYLDRPDQAFDPLTQRVLNLISKGDVPRLSTGSRFVVVEAAAGWGAFLSTTLARNPEEAVVVYIDSSEDHGRLFLQSLMELNLPLVPQGKLRPVHLFLGNYPRDIEIPTGISSVVRNARFLHFLDGPAVRQIFEDTSRMMLPGAYFVLLTSSVHLFPDAEGIIRRRREQAPNDLWPGVFRDSQTRLPNPEQYPDSGLIHLLDEPVLRREGERVGLEIIDLKLLSKNDVSQSFGTSGNEIISVLFRKDPRGRYEF